MTKRRKAGREGGLTIGQGRREQTDIDEVAVRVAAHEAYCQLCDGCQIGKAGSAEAVEGALLRVLAEIYETSVRAWLDRECDGEKLRRAACYMRLALIEGVCGGNPWRLAAVLIEACLWHWPDGLVYPGHLCSEYVWRMILPQYVARHIGGPDIPRLPERAQ